MPDILFDHFCGNFVSHTCSVVSGAPSAMFLEKWEDSNFKKQIDRADQMGKGRIGELTRNRLPQKREYFLKRKGEGLPAEKAILATAHKLVRVFFTMVSSKSYFRKEVVEV